MYGRLYIPTGRLDALYSTRLLPTIQATVAAISDPPIAGKRADSSNIMFSLQHDVGKWCSEYTYSAEDGMLGLKVLHNFGRLGTSPTDDDSERGNRVGVKRIDEEDAVEGGLRGRISAGAEFYFSAKEKSAGGLYISSSRIVPALTRHQCPQASDSQLYLTPHLLRSNYRPARHHLCLFELHLCHPLRQPSLLSSIRCSAIYPVHTLPVHLETLRFPPDSTSMCIATKAN